MKKAANIQTQRSASIMQLMDWPRPIQMAAEVLTANTYM
jgi:hypothetical protein